MNKFWKALGIAALAAAFPLRIKKNEETGKKKYQSLLLSVDVGPNEEGEGTAIDVNVGEGLITGLITDTVVAKKEAKLFTDDPEEALFADGELEVPVAEKEDETPASEPAPTPDELVATDEPTATDEPVATEDDFDPDL